MKQKSLKNTFINLSLVLFVAVCTLKSYIDNYTFTNFSLIIFIFSILLLTINIIGEKKIKIYNREFIFISFLLLIPIFYKNAYIQDHIYATFAYSILTILYGILLSVSGVTRKNIEKVFTCFGIFAIITSIVTWISFFSPNYYINNIVTLLPNYIREDIIKNFIYLNCRPGLTTHYSRNAFFIILGLLSYIYFFMRSKRQKKNNIYLIIGAFLVTTLFLIGKRGHLVFIVFSLIISYFIYNRVSLKNVLRFIGIILFSIFFMAFAVKYIPGADTAYNRLFNNETSDISSGRFEMYEDAYKLYQENHYIGIGWGQYARSTNYIHNGLHNDYLQILFETGIIGFIIIIGCNIVVFIRAIKYSRISNDYFAYIVLTYNVFFMLYSLTGLPHFDADSNMYYFFINSMLFYYIYKNKNGEIDYEK